MIQNIKYGSLLPPEYTEDIAKEWKDATVEEKRKKFSTLCRDIWLNHYEIAEEKLKEIYSSTTGRRQYITACDWYTENIEDWNAEREWDSLELSAKEKYRLSDKVHYLRRAPIDNYIERHPELKNDTEFWGIYDTGYGERLYKAAQLEAIKVMCNDCKRYDNALYMIAMYGRPKALEIIPEKYWPSGVKVAENPVSQNSKTGEIKYKKYFG